LISLLILDRTRDFQREEYNNDIEMARGFKGIAARMKGKDGVFECGEVIGVETG
jgi:hypothetical protein